MIVVVQNINLLSATLRWLFYSLHHRQLQAASSLRNQPVKIQSILPEKHIIFLSMKTHITNIISSQQLLANLGLESLCLVLLSLGTSKWLGSESRDSNSKVLVGFILFSLGCNRNDGRVSINKELVDDLLYAFNGVGTISSVILLWGLAGRL